MHTEPHVPTALIPNSGSVDTQAQAKKSSQPEFTLGDFLKLLWRRKLVAALVMVGAAVLVFVMLMRQTPMFESTAALAIDRGRRPCAWPMGIYRSALNSVC